MYLARNEVPEKLEDDAFEQTGTDFYRHQFARQDERGGNDGDDGGSRASLRRHSRKLSLQ